MCPAWDAVDVSVRNDTVIWAGGSRRAPLDVWFWPAFGDTARDDAYFTGLATQFDEPVAFHRSLVAKISRRGKRDEIFRRFASSVEQADSLTLWTLGRSVYAYQDSGAAFRRLRCYGAIEEDIRMRIAGGRQARRS